MNMYNVVLLYSFTRPHSGSSFTGPDGSSSFFGGGGLICPGPGGSSARTVGATTHANITDIRQTRTRRCIAASMHDPPRPRTPDRRVKMLRRPLLPAPGPACSA